MVRVQGGVRAGAKSVRLPIDSSTRSQVAIASQSSRFDRALLAGSAHAAKAADEVLPHGSFARLPVRTGTAPFLAFILSMTSFGLELTKGVFMSGS